MRTQVDMKCTKCKRVYHDFPGPHNQCPKCGCLYVEWLGFAKWLGSDSRSDKYRKVSGLV